MFGWVYEMSFLSLILFTACWVVRGHWRGVQTGSQEELAPAPAQGNGVPPPAPAEAQAPVKPGVQEAREWIRQWRARCEAHILVLDTGRQVRQGCATCFIRTSPRASPQKCLERL